MATKKLTKIGSPSSPESLIDRLDLYAIGLDSLEANLDRSEYSSVYADKKARISRRIESTYKLADYSEDHFDITGTLSLRVEASGLSHPILSLDTSFTGHFHPKKRAFSRGEAEQFAEAEVRLIFWPYFRQIVADTTARMHIRIITLPLAVS
jgi:preprotein translocase subunit SecB